VGSLSGEAAIMALRRKVPKATAKYKRGGWRRARGHERLTMSQWVSRRIRQPILALSAE